MIHMELKITDRTFNKNIDQIKPCELFIVLENERDEYKLFRGVFMKLAGDRTNNKNAVKLNDGNLYHINENMLLQIVNGELII